LRYTRLNKVFLLFIITAFVSVVLSLTPFMQDWEEDLGLSWLFHSRGILSAPEQVVVISIDQSSSRHFNLPNLARKWPRTLHASLINRLKESGARVIAFDIFFKSKRESIQDDLLAAAIRQSENVVLFSFLQKQVVDTVDNTGRKSRLVLDELLLPQPVFADAAIALAPNPLPKVPIKVSQFWKFVPEAGDAPSLPVVAYQLYHIDILPKFIALVLEELPHSVPVIQLSEDALGRKKQLVAVMRHLRELFMNDVSIKPRLRKKFEGAGFSQTERQTLHNMLSLYTGEASQFLNYYGPARTVTTIPYYQVLESDAIRKRLKNKLVFVGFSEHRQWEQQDGFYSVYSNEDGLDISGVEITASAAANLLDGHSVRPLSLFTQLGLLLIITTCLVALYSRVRGAWLPVSLVLIGVIYFLIAASWFSHNGTWLPLFLPLFVMTPMVILIGMIWNYQELNLERKNIQRAFGYYLPEEEVNRLARNITSHGLGGQLMHGVCLSTDAQQYTSLSEKLSPQELTAFMNEYYEAIFQPVKQCGGIISDVVGDSVMALWASPTENRLHREHAIKSAIEIINSVHEFNRQHPGYELPTRIGLHYGTMLIGNVGAVDHYEYRAVGDIVNTTTRIEGMNKYLGTRLLVSADVINDLQGFTVRNVGRFTLKGKTVPMQLFEIACENTQQDNQHRHAWRLFAEAMSLFHQGNWSAAYQAYEKVLDIVPDDAPSMFYKNYCENNKLTPPENWQGVMSMEEK